MQRKDRQQKTAHYLRNYGQLYLLVIPAVIWTLIFCYWPMYGVQIAFKKYSFAAGIFGSKWVGMKHFSRFFASPNFKQILTNTLGISLYGLVAGFPLPIILAIMLNEAVSEKFRKAVQMITYMPYFISTVAVCGMLLLFIRKDTGVINAVIGLFGGEKKELIAYPEYFWSITVWSGVWQGVGWSSIIYIAALSGVNPELVEAAIIDGANRFQKIWFVDIPEIAPTMIILLILNCGSLLSVGSEKILLLQNSLNMDASEVISTYVYRLGILNAQYDYTTAIGLFNSVVNVVLLILVNTVCSKLSTSSLW
jgi:putative aldouronate transport system permease protein